MVGKISIKHELVTCITRRLALCNRGRVSTTAFYWPLSSWSEFGSECQIP